MKISTPQSTLTTTTGGKLPTMTSRVDPEGARRIMEMLVNLYSDRKLAVVREYTSNAVDATKAAGSTEPVSITTPTLLEPNLVIADKGVGMSIEDVENAFLTFAASTKRDTNDMIGGLGVGAKSAWTMAESFMVDTVKDGLRTMVRASRDLEHQVLLASEPSDLPNGTTIIIPIKLENDTDKWERVVRDVARAHDQDMVLVNGRSVISLAGSPTWIGPISSQRAYEQDTRNFYDRITVRSGGTLFSVPQESQRHIIRETKLQSGCVIELPIGSFDHTPSRESVIATDRTDAAIDAALRQFRTAYAALKERVDKLAETDIGAAIELRVKSLGENARHNDLLPILYRVAVPENRGFVLVDGKRYNRYRWERVDNEVNNKYKFDAVNAHKELERTILVTGVPEKRVLSRFSKMLEETHNGVNRILTTPEGETKLALKIYNGATIAYQTWDICPDTEGLAAVYTFQEWEAKINARRTERGPLPGYLCVLNKGDGSHPTHLELSPAEIKAYNLPVVYLEQERDYTSRGYPGTVTVCLGRRKVEPLVAATGAISSRDWTYQQFQTETANWTEDELMAAAFVISNIHMYESDNMFNIATSALKDIDNKHPRYDLLTKIAKIVNDGKKFENKKISDSTKQLLRNHLGTQREELRKLREQLSIAYPLLRRVSYYETNLHPHYIQYIIHTPPSA